jgi:SAM-dependent methyltransferase
MFEPFGKIRWEIMRNFIFSCNPEDKIIIDLGAGNPAITDGICCKKRIKVDINPSTNPDIVCDLEKEISIDDNSVDICVASEVLEHIYHSKKLISEIKRTLKPYGILILSVPNICSLKYRFAFLIGKIPAHAAKADMFYKDDRRGHIRDYNFKEIKILLEMFNFEVLKSKSDGLSFKGKTIISPFILPKTFGDAIIIKARVRK